MRGGTTGKGKGSWTLSPVRVKKEMYVTGREVAEIGASTRRIAVYADGYVRLENQDVWPIAHENCRWESAASIVPSTTGEDQWGGRMTGQEKYEVPKDE